MSKLYLCLTSLVALLSIQTEASIINLTEDKYTLSNHVWFEGAPPEYAWSETHTAAGLDGLTYSTNINANAPSSAGYASQNARGSHYSFGDSMDISLSAESYREVETDPSIYGRASLRAYWDSTFSVIGDGSAIQLTMMQIAGTSAPDNLEESHYAWGNYYLYDLTENLLVGDSSTLTYTTALLDGHDYRISMSMAVENHWDLSAFFYARFAAKEVNRAPVPEPTSLLLLLSGLIAFTAIKRRKKP